MQEFMLISNIPLSIYTFPLNYIVEENVLFWKVI